AAVVLGHPASATEVGGVLLVGVGVVLVPGRRGRGDARALLAVAAIAASIAVYPPLVGRAALVRELAQRGVWSAAVANLGSFALGLLAIQRGAAAPVLAVRSSSIVIATLLARRLLAEEVGLARAAGSALVFAGVVMLAF